MQFFLQCFFGLNMETGKRIFGKIKSACLFFLVYPTLWKFGLVELKESVTRFTFYSMQWWFPAALSFISNGPLHVRKTDVQLRVARRRRKKLSIGAPQTRKVIPRNQTNYRLRMSEDDSSNHGDRKTVFRNP